MLFKLSLHKAFAFLAVLSVSVVSEASQERQMINFESVHYVVMAPNGKEGKGFRLSNSQAKELTERWNQARPIGLCKFFAKYIISVHGKDGITRTFRATEDTMKEENDYCFTLEDNYIGKIWKSNQ